MYVFAFDYATAQRGTAATPRRFGYSDMSSPVLYGMGLVSTADSPDPDLQTSFPPHMYVNVDTTYRLDVKRTFCTSASGPS